VKNENSRQRRKGKTMKLEEINNKTNEALNYPVAALEAGESEVLTQYLGVFPNTIGGALDLDNLADRVIRPTLKAHNLMWKGWQAYRHGLATNPKSLGFLTQRSNAF
jgi:hypothetical protein